MIGWDLLRLEGYFSTSLEEVGGTLFVDVELDKPGVPACTCGEPDVVKHGKRKVQFKDHPIQRQATYLRITRQRYRCRTCGSILLEDLPGIDADRLMTVRFRDQLAQDAIYRTFTDAANLNGVKESLVRRVFKDHAEKALAHYEFDLPRVLGMDEKVVAGSPRFVIGDVESRRMLDMQMSRKQTDLVAYFGNMHDRHKVEVITQDMYWGYKTINERYFRKALIVIDKFHVVRYANLAVEMVRKRIQNSLDNDGRVEMKRKIRLLAARPERLSLDGQIELKRLFRMHPALETAVTCKEWFYDIYNCENRAEAEKAYAAWVELLPPEMEKPFGAILTFMREKRWRPLIFNYFEHPYTNAYVEALNGLIDQITRSGRGYDLTTLRAKALLRYGNLTPLIDKVAFDLMSVSPEERQVILDTNVGHGVDLSTFESDLRREGFW